ncbi:DUF2933 domain-containing protein [Paenibacillus aceti]|uniref:DUF2933 domain-containing protein n=1 Tax=Paenibacillus aceti TaxID=1820010 RepID=A0ABQ1VRL0_9BACL|nr:DUF2933 domain-containing protein [Paenibacillus aceti]GGF92538.1 hypothetical protein GCM10010913_12670 [Paenibacillus aceti]
MEWSWLILLICPLMMIFMMFGMKGSHGHGDGHGHDYGHAVNAMDQGVQQQLRELRAQNEQLRREVDHLSRSAR